MLSKENFLKTKKKTLNKVIDTLKNIIILNCCKIKDSLNKIKGQARDCKKLL